MKEPTPDELWTRYVDWCSARVASRFLELSSEQIWDLADRTRSARERREPVAEGESPYLELVRQVTLELFADLGLPDYNQWLVRYRADPAPFDAEMIGFGDRPETISPTGRE
jgi:hypothetical protein